jgi:pyruvate/2-oxoglutarate/acetoin dehydrogenase E1 component
VKNQSLCCEKTFLVIENKILYTIENNKELLFGYNYSYNNNELLPNLVISPKDYEPEITIICYGGTLIEVEKVTEKLCLEEEIFVDIICPTQLSYISIDEIISSIKKTKKILIIEEGNNFASWSSEIVATILEKKINIDFLKRISNNEIIPSSFLAELNTLPSVDSIYNAAIKLLEND